MVSNNAVLTKKQLISPHYCICTMDLKLSVYFVYIVIDINN